MNFSGEKPNQVESDYDGFFGFCVRCILNDRPDNWAQAMWEGTTLCRSCVLDTRKERLAAGTDYVDKVLKG